MTTNGAGDGTSWANAFSNIQDASLATSDGDVILVSNGVYKTSTPTISSGTNCVVVTNNNVILKSLNGPEVTVIDGDYPTMQMRVVYITSNSTLDGFTIRNGYAIASTGRGGGVNAGVGVVITNCIVHDNYSGHYGGGILLGVSSNVVANCLIYSNTARYNGGGISTYYPQDGTEIKNCIIRDNKTVNNSASYHGGGGLESFRRVLVKNCLFYGNTSARHGGGVLVRENGGNQFFENCTIVSNTAAIDGGGFYQNTDSINTLRLRNIIIYNNTCGGVGNDALVRIAGTVSYTCVGDTTGVTDWDPANGNIAADPQFVDMTTNDYRLASQQSPCFNTGTNIDWMFDAVDLDGKKRIFNGKADMGAFEYSFKGAIYAIR